MLPAILVGVFIFLSASSSDAADPHARFEIGASGAILSDHPTYGAEIGYRFTPEFRTRVGYFNLKQKESQMVEAIQFSQDLNQNNIRMTFDFFPWDNLNLYGNVGAVHLGEPESFTITPTDGRSYTVNGVLYSSAQLGKVAGIVVTHKTVPYIGVGWAHYFKGNRPGWYFQMEAGMVSNLEPRLDIQSVNSSAPPSLTSDVEAQADKESAKLPDAYTIYAIIIGYRF